jgi:hypothetical protein
MSERAASEEREPRGEIVWAVWMQAKRSGRWYLFHDTVARTRRQAIVQYNKSGPVDAYAKDKALGRVLARRGVIFTEWP